MTSNPPPFFKQLKPSKAYLLDHYLGVLAEAKAAAPAEPAPPQDFNRAVRAHRLEVAMRAAQFEANHMGEFNHSGKEIYSKQEKHRE